MNYCANRRAIKKAASEPGAVRMKDFSKAVKINILRLRPSGTLTLLWDNMAESESTEQCNIQHPWVTLKEPRKHLDISMDKKLLHAHLCYLFQLNRPFSERQIYSLLVCSYRSVYKAFLWSQSPCLSLDCVLIRAGSVLLKCQERVQHKTCAI